jgi:hypothetical protein
MGLYAHALPSTRRGRDRTFDHIKTHYYGGHRTINPTRVVAAGPRVDMRADSARFSKARCLTRTTARNHAARQAPRHTLDVPDGLPIRMTVLGKKRLWPRLCYLRSSPDWRHVYDRWISSLRRYPDLCACRSEGPQFTDFPLFCVEPQSCRGDLERRFAMTSRSSIKRLGAPLVAFCLTIWPLVSPLHAVEGASARQGAGVNERH